MTYSFIEMAAIALIAVAALKFLLYLIDPGILLGWGRKIAKHRNVATVVTGALAALLFLKLTAAGITATTLLAVFLFYGLIMLMALLRYYDSYLDFIEKKGLGTIMKEAWSVYVIYLLLIALAVKELFL